MQANELQEMEWLASQLSTTASRLTRAVALLRNNADLERAEARIAALAIVKPSQTTAASAARDRPAASTVGDRRAAVASPGRLADRPANARTGSSTEGVAGVLAVFDAGSFGRVESALNRAGNSDRVAGGVVNTRQKLDEIPF